MSESSLPGNVALPSHCGAPPGSPGSGKRDSPKVKESPSFRVPRSDLYALGAVGYYLLTGHSVFEAATVVEIIGHHLHTEPAPPSRRTVQSIPPDLEALVLQCLRKRTEDRPQSARALREALRACALVPPWTSDDAARWWRSFRSAGGVTEHHGADSAHGLTVTVDTADRLTQAAINPGAHMS